MVAQLEGAGIAVDLDPVEYPNGRIARVEDPEGNPVQLWEPCEATLGGLRLRRASGVRRAD